MPNITVYLFTFRSTKSHYFGIERCRVSSHHLYHRLFSPSKQQQSFLIVIIIPSISGISYTAVCLLKYYPLYYTQNRLTTVCVCNILIVARDLYPSALASNQPTNPPTLSHHRDCVHLAVLIAAAAERAGTHHQ